MTKSKLFVSLGPNLPIVNSSQIKTRPSTAKAMSNKLTDTDFGYSRAPGARTPSHNFPTNLSKEEAKNLRSEAINELERLGIEEEEY